MIFVSVHDPYDFRDLLGGVLAIVTVEANGRVQVSIFHLIRRSIRIYRNLYESYNYYNMFWALILEPFKRYTQEVKQTFRITMASLDTSLAANNEAIQIMVHNNKKNFLLCTLIKGKINQVPLDLKFKKGTEITLFSNGQGYVHLTGYVEESDSKQSSNNEANDPEEQKEVNEQAQKKLEGNKKDLTKSDARQKMEKPKLNKAKQDSLNESSNQDADEFSEEDSDNIENSDNVEEDDENDSDEYKYYHYDDDDDDDSDNDDNEEEEEDEEEEEEKEEEKQDQKREQNKLTKSQKQEKISENQQQKKKHDKQIKMNGEEIKQQQQNMKRKRKLENHAQQNNPSEAKKKIVEGGVQVEDLKLGSGQPVRSGDILTVFYIGRCKIGKEDKKVDAYTKGKGYKFRLCRGQVLKGWDVGLVGMKLGGKRRLTIPSEMGYGSRGFPPTIPPFSTLTYEIELKDVERY